MKKNSFNDLTKNQLWKLRQEICVNSIFVSDYENSYGYDAKAVSDFFDGYYDFMWELAEEKYDLKNIDHDFVMKNFDNKDILWEWFNCSDDLSWIN